MKKQLLFILPSLSGGGAEKSLITLLSLLDYDRYDVDLFLFRREGLFVSNVPEQVRITDAGENYKAFDGEASVYIKSCALSLKIPAVINRIKYSSAIKSNNRSAMWSCLKKALPEQNKHYDIAIGYLEGNANYYCLDCVHADKKIGYIHNDYIKLGLDKSFDYPFFKRLDKIASVSEECCNVLCETFAEFKDKIFCIENICSVRALHMLSGNQPEEFKDITGKILLTIGRFSPQKGYDTAVEAAKIMRDNGVNFKWFAIGKGDLQTHIEEKIKEYALQDRFILLGEKANPYPYINSCDIYVQPSNFEGKSIAIDEAKAFYKPIVATKFPTVFDQLTDNKTALLADINPQSVAEKICLLAKDNTLCNELSENLRQTHRGNEEEINKFYSLLED